MKLIPRRFEKKHILVAIGCLLIVWAAAPFVKGMVNGGEFLVSVGIGLLAAAKLIAGAILIAFGCVDSFSFPFTRFIDAVFGLAPDSRKPPLDFTQADKFLEMGMLEAAEREYRRLLEYYPDSMKTWKRLITLVSTDSQHCDEIMNEARRHFRFDRERLQRLELHLQELNSTAELPHG